MKSFVAAVGAGVILAIFVIGLANLFGPQPKPAQKLNTGPGVTVSEPPRMFPRTV